MGLTTCENQVIKPSNALTSGFLDCDIWEIFDVVITWYYLSKVSWEVINMSKFQEKCCKRKTSLCQWNMVQLAPAVKVIYLCVCFTKFLMHVIFKANCKKNLYKCIIDMLISLYPICLPYNWSVEFCNLFWSITNLKVHYYKLPNVIQDILNPHNGRY